MPGGSPSGVPTRRVVVTPAPSTVVTMSTSSCSYMQLYKHLREPWAKLTWGDPVYICMYQFWPAEHTCDHHMYMSTPARSRALQRQDVMFP